MDKKCIICGAVFQAPPSSKKVTCSAMCRSVRAAEAARKSSGRKWSEAKKRKRSRNPEVKAQMRNIQKIAVQEALKNPEGQKGSQNRESLLWVLVDPAGKRHAAINLVQWARENYMQFDPLSSDAEQTAQKIAKGFRAIASSMRRVKSRVRPVYHYKGWGLDRLPAEIDKRLRIDDAIRVMDCYFNGMSINAISAKTSVNYQRVIRILVSASLLDTPEAALYRSGKSVAEIAQELGENESYVAYRVPYSKGMYRRDHPTDNALRIRKSRKKNGGTKDDT